MLRDEQRDSLFGFDCGYDWLQIFYFVEFELVFFHTKKWPLSCFALGIWLFVLLVRLIFFSLYFCFLHLFFFVRMFDFNRGS